MTEADGAGEVPTHAHCGLCDAITPLRRKPLDQPSVDGLYRGGDYVCSVCGSILLGVFRQAEPR